MDACDKWVVSCVAVFISHVVYVGQAVGQVVGETKPTAGSRCGKIPFWFNFILAIVVMDVLRVRQAIAEIEVGAAVVAFAQEPSLPREVTFLFASVLFFQRCYSARLSEMC